MSATAEPEVHPTAVVDPAARLGSGVRVGPYSVIGPDVTLADGVWVKSHAVVTGRTEVGEGTIVFPFATLGEIPQDLKFKGEDTRLVIGARCQIRENATVHVGTAGGGGITRIGSDCLLMACSHVAHDVTIGDRVILANSVAIGGHCVIEDDAILSGLVGVHQWVRVGRGAILGAGTMIRHDVIPYGLVHGPRGTLEGLNLVGLRRRGVPREDIAALRAAFETLAEGEGEFRTRARKLQDEADSSYVREIVDFILTASDRSYLTPGR